MTIVKHSSNPIWNCYKIEIVNPCDGESDSVTCGTNSNCIQTWGGDELCIDADDKKACDESGTGFFECETGCHFCEELVCDFQTHYVECDVPEVQLSADDLATVLTPKNDPYNKWNFYVGVHD